MAHKNLDFFKSIGTKVFSYFSKNHENVLEKERIKLELKKDFESYLQVGDVLFCIEMMETGYIVEKNQKKSLEEKLTEKVFNKEVSYKELLKFNHVLQNEVFVTLPFLFDYMRNNNELEKNYLSIVKTDTIDNVVESFMKFMISFTNFYKKGLDVLSKFRNYNEEELKDKFETFDAYKKLFKELYNNGVMNGESFISFSKHLENAIKEMKLLTNKDKQLNDSFENIKLDYLEKVRLEMREYAVTHTNLSNKYEVLNKIKKISNDSIEKDIKNLAIKRNYSINQLQEENKTQIKKIEILTEKINQSEVNEFIETRLPIILEKYLSIDKEYRTTLKNIEGYNAQELMTQSLENIIVLLNEKLENKNTDLIKELSVENRKLKVR